MRIHVSHQTRYEYGGSVRFLPHFLYLRPREYPLLQVQKFHLRISPQAQLYWMNDDQDNLLASANFATLAQTLEIHSDFEAVTGDTKPLDFIAKDYAQNFPFAYEPLHSFNLTPYLTKPSAETQTGLTQWLDARLTDRPRETMRFLFNLNQAVHRSLAPYRREEPGIQPSLQTVALGSGSCRDYAVLLMEIARTLGLAARFVSGYYYDPALVGSPGAAMHAWAEVYLPGAGWKGLDPTTGLFCYDAYVPVAHAAVAESVNPIQGTFFANPPTNARLFTRVLVEKLG